MFWGHWTQDGQTIHPCGGFSYVWETLPQDNNKEVQELSTWKIINRNYLMMRFLKRNHIKLYLEKVLMESQGNKSKIIIRRLGMNRIQYFLQDYKSLNPYLKVSRHPYPNEYLSIP